MNKPGDARLGSLLEEGLHGDVVFILWPCDEGVRRNGGRVGARLAPERFLHFLKGTGSVCNPEHSVDLSVLTLSYHTVNLEDLDFDRDDALDTAHRRLTNAVRVVLEAGGLPFCVGGGNDQSFANWRGLRQVIGQEAKVGVVNIDAHLDVRPLVHDKRPHSGSPFRQVLESEKENQKGTIVLCEFAAQGSQCSKNHAEYVTANGGSIMWLNEVRLDAVSKFEHVLDSHQQSGIHNDFVSFDLDAIKASDCPGVSCPANTGLTAEDALGIMKAAGERDNVKLVDMSELNVQVENYITPRLAVQMAYSFLLGYCKRISNQQASNPRKNNDDNVAKQRAYRLRISNLSQLICVEDVQKKGFRTGEYMKKLNVIENGTVLVDRKGCIAYVGPTTDAPDIDPDEIDQEINGFGKAAIPGLCDGHTHSCWAGDRVDEFSMKLAGATYMDIHKMGGGINFTVKHTQQEDEESLYRSLVDRLNQMSNTGTTLVECKSGYGLDTETELKMLRVIDRAQNDLEYIEVVGNFCGAHSIPQGATEEEALDTVVNEMLPALAKEQENKDLLSTKMIDVFVEDGVFSAKSAKAILMAGAEIGLVGNFHGDEITYQGCGELAGKLQSRAVSHLEHVSDEGIAAMKESHTAAVLLPTTAYLLRMKPPPARKLIDGGVPVALGSDFNPNAHCSSMPHVMNLACVTMNMCVEEALVASTLNAAYSVGMQDTHGSLEIGKHGDIVLVNAIRWEHIIYQFGGVPPLYAVIKDGVVTHTERT